MERKHKLRHLPDNWSSLIKKQKDYEKEMKLSGNTQKGILFNHDSLESIYRENNGVRFNETM